jgi:hypothetical protein
MIAMKNKLIIKELLQIFKIDSQPLLSLERTIKDSPELSHRLHLHGDGPLIYSIHGFIKKLERDPAINQVKFEKACILTYKYIRDNEFHELGNGDFSKVREALFYYHNEIRPIDQLVTLIIGQLIE